MIGGFDVRIPTAMGKHAIEIAIRAIQRNWPGAVFENASTADRYDHIEEIPFGRLDEIFVYRDSRAFEAWDSEGAIPELANTMIHILFDPGLLTLVFDEVDDSNKELIDTVRADLEDVSLF